MIKEVQFDGTHGKIVTKNAFAFLSPGLELRRMPRGKIDLQKVLASLNKRCPKCGQEITPAEFKRVRLG